MHIGMQTLLNVTQIQFHDVFLVGRCPGDNILLAFSAIKQKKTGNHIFHSIFFLTQRRHDGSPAGISSPLPPQSCRPPYNKQNVLPIIFVLLFKYKVQGL